MSYVTAEARQELLDGIAAAGDELAVALAFVGEAYELLDEANGDRLEEELFRPIQAAYGGAQRTHAAFAARYELPGRAFAPQEAGLPSDGARLLVDRTVEAVEEADAILAELQDSMLPVEVGDPEVRAGIADVRTHLAHLPHRAREFVRTLGR
jgi:hypothetical protein